MDFNLQEISDVKLKLKLLSQMNILCRRDKSFITRFPGAQPKSFTEELFDKNEEYYVAEKSDGVRFLMLVYRNEEFSTDQYGHVFFINRKLNVFHNENIEDLWKKSSSLLFMLNNSLFDGEYIKENDNSESFYQFDAIAIQNTFVGNLSFFDRNRLAKSELIDQIAKLGLNIGLNFFQKEQFLAEKVFVKHLFEMIENGALTHKNDGLIFTKNQLGYFVDGKLNPILKWKPLKDLTVDFEYIRLKNRLKSQVKIEKGFLYGYYKNYKFRYATIEGVDEKYDKKIIECSYNEDEKKWKYERHRDDKKRGNDLYTIKNVMENYKNKIDEEKLLEIIGEK